MLTDVCKLYSYDLTGREGFREWGVLAVDRSPYYAYLTLDRGSICRDSP